LLKATRAKNATARIVCIVISTGFYIKNTDCHYPFGLIEVKITTFARPREPPLLSMTDYGTDISQHAESVEILERKNVRMILQNFVATHSTKTIEGNQNEF